MLEPVTVGPEEFEDAAAEFARPVQIVSRLPDQFLSSEDPVARQLGGDTAQIGTDFALSPSEQQLSSSKL